MKMTMMSASCANLREKIRHLNGSSRPSRISTKSTSRGHTPAVGGTGAKFKIPGMVKLVIKVQSKSLTIRLKSCLSKSKSKRVIFSLRVCPHTK